MNNKDYWLGNFVFELYAKPRKVLVKLLAIGIVIGFLISFLLFFLRIENYQLRYYLDFLKIYPPFLAIYGFLVGRRYDILKLKTQIISDDPGARPGFVLCRIGFAGFGFLIMCIGCLIAFGFFNLGVKV